MLPLNSCRGIFLALLLALAAVPAAFGQLQTNEIFRVRVHTEFLHRQTALAAAPNDASNCWQFARACFDWADFSTNDDQRADIARLGIDAARRLVSRDSNSAAGHYYLAMNDGQLAQAVEPSLQAFHLVNELEREFIITDGLDPHFDHAGPARNLGLLYRDAPTWPLSVGSRSKARHYLEQAATLDPGYPGNPLNLAETQLRWHLYDDARPTLQKLNAIWPAAQTNFTGAVWELDWSSWTPRRGAALADFKKATGHAP